jgi:DnaJ-class molecular chaperone
MPETRIITCTTCDGDGYYEQRHPAWGTYSCPEPTITVRCDDCDGTGKIEVDVEPTDEDDLGPGAGLEPATNLL